MDARNEVAKQAGQDGGAGARVATFDELPIEQKIDRMRFEVQLLRDLVNSQQSLIDRLMEHRHVENGSMVVPMHRSGIGGMSIASGRRDTLR